MKFTVGVALFLITAGAAFAEDSAKAVPFSSLSAPLQQAVQKELAGGKLGEITVTIENGENTYDVEATKNGVSRAFTLAEDGRLTGREVTLDEMPPKVKTAILQQAGKATLTEIDQTFDDDEVIFEVELKLDGKLRSFSVADDGVLLSAEIAFQELPPPVRKSVDALKGKGVVKSVEKDFDGPDTTYEIGIEEAGRERALSFSADGVMESSEVALAETPAPVQKTIQEHLNGGTVQNIDRNIDGNIVTYDVKVIGPGKADFSVAQSGALLSIRVSLAQVAPEARKTIQEKIGDGKILWIDQVFGAGRNGGSPYEIQGRKNGKNFDFSVGPKGKFLGMDE